MIKKLSIIILVLLLSSVLMISCNNKDKTSSTTKGLAYYAGEYNANESNKEITVTFLFSSDNNGTFTFEVQDSLDKGKGTLTKTTVSLQ